jgi:hypothetical protein
VGALPTLARATVGQGSDVRGQLSVLSSQVRSSGLGVMHPTLGKWIMGIRSGLFVLDCVGLFWFGGVGAGAVFAGAGGAAAGRAADRWDWSEATGSGFAVDSGWAD